MVKKLLDASSVSKLRLFKLNHKYQGIQQNLIFFLFDIVSVVVLVVVVVVVFVVVVLVVAVALGGISGIVVGGGVVGFVRSSLFEI